MWGLDHSYKSDVNVSRDMSQLNSQRLAQDFVDQKLQFFVCEE